MQGLFTLSLVLGSYMSKHHIPHLNKQTTGGLLGYKEAADAYFYQGLQEAFDDGVSYLEFRGRFLPDVSSYQNSSYQSIVSSE